MNNFLIRGSFSNQFELQNYEPISEEFNLRLISSKSPITKANIPTTYLHSPHDLPNFPYKKALLNRVMGDSHWLLGLENIISGSDIVHTAETYYAFTHQAVELKKRGGIKTLISTCWETIPFNNETIARKRKWKEEAKKHIDLFITPTEKAKSALIKEGVSEKKIKLIRVGIDLNRFKPANKKRNKVKQILFVGRAVGEKGIEELLSAVNSLDQKIELKVIGKGSLPRAVGTNVKQISVPYDQIHKHYQEADIFVLPSKATKTWEEQYGMVLVEAMASGLPIVTTRSGAIPEVVGDAAVLVKEGSSESLRSGIESLAPLKRRQELWDKARKRAEQYFDKNKIAVEISDLYNTLI